MRKVIDALLPPGAIWTPKEDGDFDKLLDGIAANFDDTKTFLKALAYIREPSKTPVLSDLEREFGIQPNDSVSDADRRQQLAAVKYAKGGNGGRDYLQSILRGAGFDVYVHDNDPPIDPSTVVSTIEYIVSGRFDSVIAALTSEDWPMVFFIGGLATRDGITDEILSIDIAAIPIDSAFTFKRIIQRIQPMHAWASLAVVGYKPNYFGYFEDAGASTFGDSTDPDVGGYFPSLIS